MARQREDPLRGLGDLESVLRSIIEGTADIVWIKDRDGIYVMVNEAFGVFAGRPAAQIIGQLDDSLFEPDAARIYQDTDRQVMASGQPLRFESSVTMPVGPRTHLVTKSAVRDRSGTIVGVVGIAHDITALRAAELAKAESEERYRRIVETSPDGVWVHRSGVTLFVNTAMAEIIGAATTADLLGRSIYEFVLPEDTEVVRQRVEGAEFSGRPAPPELRTLRRLDGTTVRTDVAVEPTTWEGRPAVQAVVRDVTARVAAEEALRATEERHAQQLLHDAMHDTLTGLPNRALFMEELQLAVDRRIRRPEYGFTVLFLDLDRFKVINDSLGHMAGDTMLVEMATRIQRGLRPGDRVARLGGDEFTILLDDIDDVASATRIADRIQIELEAPFVINGRDIFTSCSIGIALSKTGYSEPEAVLRDADLAMYRPTGRGRARYEVFDLGMHATALQRLEIETDLRRAIERQEFRVFYQPVFLTTGRLMGFEALVRWQHPTRGQVDPGDFIDIAEETHLTVAIGRQVLQEACRQLREWLDCAQGRRIAMGVNISGKQLLGPGLVEEVARALYDNNLEPGLLHLEITENILMEDAEIAADVLAALKAIGVKLFMDDFGTGYSSLSYLRRFPLDGLKIDRFFVSHLEEPDNLELVRTIISLGRNLGLTVVAEGVEHLRQLEALEAMGCGLVQGFYLSRPLDATQARLLLDAPHGTPQHSILQT